MNRPQDYDELRVTVRNMTYQCEDENFNGMHTAGGVLSKGQMVWIRKSPAFAYKISAYVEGVGLVIIDPRFLVRLVDENHSAGVSQKLPDSQARVST